MASKFASLTDSQLRSLYRVDIWANLSEKNRHSLLQETVDREIATMGGNFTCTVSFKDLSHNISGQQNGTIIELNRDMFVNDKQSFSFTDRGGIHQLRVDLEDSNYRSYETVIHEFTHVVQDMKRDNIVLAKPEEKAIIEANDFTVSMVDNQRASQYMDAGDFMLYYLNPTERQARRISEAKTMELIEEIRNSFGEEKAMALYSNHIARSGFDAKMAEYSARLNTTELAQSVDNTLLNAKFGTNLPVDKGIEKLVHDEMIKTQAIIDHRPSLVNIKEKEISTNMSNNLRTSVSRAEMNQTLRDSYTHELEKGATPQQAMEATAPMAENYLTAMEEFNAAQNATQNTGTGVDAETTADNSVSVSAAVGVEADNTVETDNTAEADAEIEAANEVDDSLDNGADNDDGIDMD